MDLRHLRYLQAVADEKGIVRAARKLNLSQPALSIQIRQMEERLGFPLLTRTRPAELTPAGQELVHHARGVFEKFETALRSARRRHSGETAELSIGFMSSVAYTYLPPVVRGFRDQFPDVELSFREAHSWQQFSQLRDGNIDVGIVRGPVAEEGISSIVVLRESLVVALHAEHRLAELPAIPIKALADEGFIIFPTQYGSSHSDEILRLCRRAGFKPRIVQEAIQLYLVVALVGARIGIGLVPESIQILDFSGVVYRPLAENDSQVLTSIAYRNDNDMPAVANFARISQEVFLKSIVSPAIP